MVAGYVVIDNTAEDDETAFEMEWTQEEAPQEEAPQEASLDI